MPSSIQGVLTLLKAQMQALVANFSDVAANRPAPARQVLISTLVTVGVIWLVFKIIKKSSK